MERSKTDGAIGCLRTIDERCELMPIPRGDNLAPKPRQIHPRGTKLRGIPPLQLRSKYSGNVPSGLRKISQSYQNQSNYGMSHHGLRCPNVVASHSLTSTISSSRRELKVTPDDNNKGQPFRTASSTTWAAAKGPSHIPTVERKSSMNDPRFRKVITPANNRWEKRSTADSSADVNDCVNSTGRNSPNLMAKIPNVSYDTSRKYQIPDKEKIPTHGISEEAPLNSPKVSPRSLNNAHKPVIEEEYSDSSSGPSSATGGSKSINSVINAEQCVKTTRLKIDYTEKTCNSDKAYTPTMNPPRENIGSKFGTNANLSPRNDEQPKSNDNLSTEYSTGEDEEIGTQAYYAAKGETKHFSFGAGDFEEELKNMNAYKDSQYYPEEYVETYSESSYGEWQSARNEHMKCCNTNCKRERKKHFGFRVPEERKLSDLSTESEIESDADTSMKHKRRFIRINWNLISAILSTIILAGVVIVATNYFMPIYVDWLTSFYSGEYQEEQSTSSMKWFPDIVEKMLSFIINLFAQPRRCKYHGWISRKNCQRR